jgi:hypothetical protein
MKKVWLVGLVLALLLALSVGVASAQDNGSIRGAVYQDVNGDGRCVNTGVPGEVPVAGVDLEFVNTGGDYKLNLYTGDNGTYGLVAAGFGYWRVTAMPASGWVVTSQNPVITVIDHDKPLALDVNFCVFRGYVVPGFPTFHPVQTLPAVLPVSGAPAEPGNGGMITAVIALVGLSLVGAGVGLEVRRRAD